MATFEVHSPTTLACWCAKLSTTQLMMRSATVRSKTQRIADQCVVHCPAQCHIRRSQTPTLGPCVIRSVWTRHLLFLFRESPSFIHAYMHTNVFPTELIDTTKSITDTLNCYDIDHYRQHITIRTWCCCMSLIDFLVLLFKLNLRPLSVPLRAPENLATGQLSAHVCVGLHPPAID